MGISQISKASLQRLPRYITYLNSLPKNGPDHISATAIAQALGLGEVQVRKDLAAVTSGGKPKVGYVVSELIDELNQFLGYNNRSEAVLVGCGQMGRAILDYQCFNDYGLEIVAGFDINAAQGEATPRGKKILPMQKLKGLCSRRHIRLAVVAVPKDQTQAVCDELVACGIRGIVNITPAHVTVPADVVVRYTNLAIELAMLAGQLEELDQNSSPQPVK